MPSSFRTIKSPGQGEYIEKKSKFLAYAYPVISENEIKNSLEAIKKMHPAARQICYAYRLGANKDIWKANDGGEPANTAGQPILGQLKSLDLTNIIVIVVRYFGGIKLGVGGLMAAYKEAAAAALSHTDIIGDFEKELLVFEVPFSSMSKTEYFLNKAGIPVIEKNFGDGCTFQVLIPKNDAASILEELKAINGLLLK